MTDPEIEAVLRQLPPGLRALLDRELAAGNGVAWAGGGHPAPPIGASVMLERGLSSAELPVDAVLVRRGSSLYEAEITDGDRRYFILTPPVPPPPMASMDEIRAAHQGPPFDERRPSIEEVLFGRLELDIRGETLLFYKGAWRATIDWTYTRGHQVYRSSLSDWFDPVARKTIPMSPTERKQVLEQIVDLARIKLGSAVAVED